jgi:hypothetical protein
MQCRDKMQKTYKVDFENFDKEIPNIIKKAKKVKKSCEDSMKVDSRTMYETVY